MPDGTTTRLKRANQSASSLIYVSDICIAYLLLHPGACRRLGGTEVCPGCDSRSEAGEKEAACWVGDSEPMEERVSGSGQESNK